MENRSVGHIKQGFLFLLPKGRLHNPNASWPTVLAIFIVPNTNNHPEPPVNWRLDFEVTPKIPTLYGGCNKNVA